MRPSGTLILTIAILMLVVGVVATIIWWRLADVIFPGTSERTGQYIGRKKKAGPPPEKPRVISGFDGPAASGPAPQQPPAGDIAGPSDPIPPGVRPPNSPPVS